MIWHSTKKQALLDFILRHMEQLLFLVMDGEQHRSVAAEGSMSLSAGLC